MSNENNEELDTATDLTIATVMAPLGFLGGIVRSWIDPFVSVKEINYIKSRGIHTLTDYSAHVFGAIGYGTGIYHILSVLSEDSKDVRSYIPLITNLVGAGVQLGYLAYKQGKKKGLEQLAKSEVGKIK